MNPLSSAEPWNIVSDGYITDTQPYFNKWAKDSFKRIKLEDYHKVVDIACGPGNEKKEPTVVRELDNHETCIEELSQAGFKNISVESIKHKLPVETPELFWESMIRGGAPINMMKYKLSKEDWKKKELVAKRFVVDNLKDTDTVYSTAILTIGEK